MNEDSTQTIIIKPTRGFSFIDFKAIWEYRELAYMFILRDLKARYKQTAIGPIWIILSPIISTVVFSVLLGKVARLSSEGIPYPVFTYIGLLGWGLFSKTVNGTVTSLQKEIALMAKVYFPRLIAVISYILSNFIDFLISLIILFVMLLIYGLTPSLNLLLLPFIMILIMFTGMSIGLWFAGPNVKFRDISSGVMLVLSFFQYLSPVVYSASEIMKIIPDKWQFLYYLNPFTFFVESFRWSIIGTEVTFHPAVLISYLIIILLFIGGLVYFRRWERTIVDIQ